VRAKILGLALGATLFTQSASAYDPFDPANCNGVEWDDKRTLLASKVTSAPRVNFVKSPYDDDFKAEACPAATDACRKASYLVTNDLVLTARTRGPFTCISYQSPAAKKIRWATGWLPSSALAPVKPMASPQVSDWLGTWEHPGGYVAITRGDGDRLHVDGLMLVPGARDVHNGALNAQVTAKGDTIAFVEDGSMAWETDYTGCRARMQRIGPFLMVEDNDWCGGAGVSFTGLYHRKR
jgi:hypothetical protein